MTKFNLATLTIVIYQISFTSSVLAAKYDLLDEQQLSVYESSDMLNKINMPGLNREFTAFADQEKENKKARYLPVVNLIKQKKFEQAREEISSLLRQTPDAPSLYNLLALMDISDKNNSSAKQNFQKAIKLDPENALAYYSLAKLAVSEQQLDKAKEYADKVLTINDKVPGTYFLSAGVSYKRGDKQEAEQILLAGYKKLQGNINNETRIITALSKFYITQKQPEKTLFLGQDIVKRYPDNSQALSILASAQFVNNQKKLAKQTLQKIIQLEKKDTKHRILLARLLSDDPDKEEDVVRLLDETFEIKPANPQALVLKTVYFVKLKHYQHALNTTNKIEQLFPTLAIGKQLKGDIYLADKKFDNALEAYQQAYQIAPNNKILVVMADLMALKGKQTDAIKLLKNEMGKHSNNSAINFKLATLYQRQKDYKQAGKYFSAILTEQPDNVLVLNNLAWIYAQQNNPDAIKLAEQAFNRAPDSAAVADTYGYILIKQGELEKGRKILQKAAKAAPLAGEIQFHLAEAYSLTNEKQKAIFILESLNKETKPFPEKENAKQLLLQLKSE